MRITIENIKERLVMNFRISVSNREQKILLHQQNVSPIMYNQYSKNTSKNIELF